MALHHLFREIHARTEDDWVRCWLKSPSLSEREFVERLPDLFTVALSSPSSDPRVQLLIRHYGLGTGCPESLVEMARRDGVELVKLRADLDAALAIVTTGVADLAWVHCASPWVAAERRRIEELRAVAGEVIAGVWQMPRDTLPEGFAASLERLSVLCARDMAENHPVSVSKVVPDKAQDGA